MIGGRRFDYQSDQGRGRRGGGNGTAWRTSKAREKAGGRLAENCPRKGVRSENGGGNSRQWVRRQIDQRKERVGEKVHLGDGMRRGGGDH